MAKRLLPFVPDGVFWVGGERRFVLVTGMDPLLLEHARSPLELADGAEVSEVPHEAPRNRDELEAWARLNRGRLFSIPKDAPRFVEEPEMTIEQALAVADNPLYLNLGRVECHRRLRRALDVLAAAHRGSPAPHER